MVVVRKLTRTVHRWVEGTTLLLVMRWMLLLLLLHSWSRRPSHVVRMVVVVMMMAGGIHMRRGHAGLGLWHLATVHVLVDVVRRLLTATGRTIVEVGLVVQRWWTIAKLLLLLGVTLELSWEGLLWVSHDTVRSGGGGFL